MMKVSTNQDIDINREMIDEMIRPRRIDSAIIRLRDGNKIEFAEISLINPCRCEWPQHEIVITSNDLRSSNLVDHSWDEPLTNEEYEAVAEFLMGK